MKIRVLRSALEDLASGREFYNQQQQGVGDYFFNSLFSEFDSLVLYAGIHRVQFGYHRLLARRFPCPIVQSEEDFVSPRSNLAASCTGPVVS